MRRTWLPAAMLVLSAAIAGPAWPFEPMEGCFVATAVCPAGPLDQEPRAIPVEW